MYILYVQTARTDSRNAVFFLFFLKKICKIVKFAATHIYQLPLLPVPLPLTKCPPKSRQNGPPVSPTKIRYFQYVLYVRTARASSRTRQSPEKPRTRTDRPHEPTELPVRSPTPVPPSRTHRPHTFPLVSSASPLRGYATTPELIFSTAWGREKRSSLILLNDYTLRLHFKVDLISKNYKIFKTYILPKFTERASHKFLQNYHAAAFNIKK